MVGEVNRFCTDRKEEDNKVKVKKEESGMWKDAFYLAQRQGQRGVINSCLSMSYLICVCVSVCVFQPNRV